MKVLISNMEIFISRCLARNIPAHVEKRDSAYKNPRNMIYRYENLFISGAIEVWVAAYVATTNSRMPVIT